MPRLSRLQEQARRRIVDLSMVGLAPEPLSKAILDAIGSAVPADGWVLYGLDPGTLLFNRVLGERSAIPEARLLVEHYLTSTYLVREPGQLSPPGLMRAAIPAVLTRDRLDDCWGLPPGLVDETTTRQWGRFVHEDIGAPPGGTLSVHFASGGSWVAALDGLRVDAHRPFRPGEAGFLRRLAPTIGGALRAALARERAGEATAASELDSAGVVVIGPDGRLRLCTPAAEQWIGRMRDTWRPEPLGVPRLPVAIWAAVAQHRAGSWPRGLLVATPAGPLRIESSAAGPDGAVCVVLTPERPPAAPHIPDTWPLTPTERLVVESIALGRSNRATATALSVTEHTVEFHLGNAYEKLDVRGRGPLLARLFRDACWPAFRFPNDQEPLGSR